MNESVRADSPLGSASPRLSEQDAARVLSAQREEDQRRKRPKKPSRKGFLMLEQPAGEIVGAYD